MDDQTYYRRRTREEEEAARIATCREARDRHDELASAYRLRARLLFLLHRRRTERHANTPTAAEIRHELA